MKRITFIVALLIASLNAATAQNKTTSDDIARTITPYVEESTVAVFRIDLTRVQLDPLFKRFQGLLGALVEGDVEKQRALRQMDAAKTLVQMYLSALNNAGASEVYAVITMEPLPEPPVLVVVPVNEKVDVDALTPLVQMVTLQMPVEQKRIGDAIVIGSKSHVTQLKLGKSDRTAELKQAFAATGDAAIQMVVIPPRYMVRAIEELVTELPKATGGGPGTRITRGFVWGAVGIKLPPDFKIEATVKSADADAAGEFVALVKALLQTAKAESKGQLPDSLMERLTPRREKDQVRWTFTDKHLDGLTEDLKPLIEAQQNQAKQIASMNHMRQIGIALLTYTGDNDDAFPPDLASLLKSKVIVQPSTFLSPISGQALPKDFRRWDDAVQKKWINENASYIYVPNLKLTKDNSATIVLIEKKSSALLGKVCVGYLDGSVRLQSIEEASAQLMKQTGFNYE